jgi:hypothetical protein
MSTRNREPSVAGDGGPPNRFQQLFSHHGGPPRLNAGR